MGSSKEHVTSAKLVKKYGYNKNFDVVYASSLSSKEVAAYRGELFGSHAPGIVDISGEIFEYFQVPVKEWQVQTTKDVLGEVDHATIPSTYRGANAPMQCLRASLTAKGEKIAALKVSQLPWISCTLVTGLSMLGWSKKTLDLKKSLLRLKQHWILKEPLILLTKAALDTERSSSSAHLKHIVDLLAKGSLS
ncbi:hypothetical protein KY289_008113 [Solanum tuberosum]|nr:hypothetical protein KY289_008113 [Solanum tuberosum]